MIMAADTTIQEQSDYLRRLVPYFVTSLILLGVGIVFGITAASFFPDISHRLEDSFAEFGKMFRGLPKLQLAAAIFINNALKTLVVITFGTLAGVIPVLFLVVNGVTLGVVMYSSVQSRGLWPSLLAILPHGVLELPAVLAGAAIGLLLGNHSIRRLLGTAETTLSSELGRALRFFLSIIVPFLLVAAVIESFISSVLVQL
jgi:stage II sporulation protein M